MVLLVAVVRVFVIASSSSCGGGNKSFPTFEAVETTRAVVFADGSFDSLMEIIDPVELQRISAEVDNDCPSGDRLGWTGTLLIVVPAEPLLLAATAADRRLEREPVRCGAIVGRGEMKLGGVMLDVEVDNAFVWLILLFDSCAAIFSRSS
jgi:hypothetical protein